MAAESASVIGWGIWSRNHPGRVRRHQPSRLGGKSCGVEARVGTCTCMNGSAANFLVVAGLIALITALQPAVAATEQIDSEATFTVTVTDMAGRPVANAQVAVVLKTGAHQKNKTGENGEVVLQRPKMLAALWAAGVGYEARSVNYKGDARVKMNLDTRKGISSAIVYGSTKLEGTGGAIEVHYGNGRNPYMYGTSLGFMQYGRPVGQPVHFRARQPTIALNPEGRKFRIYILKGMDRIALVEYSMPDGR